LTQKDEGSLRSQASGEVVQSVEDLPEIRVPITVFASVRAVDFGEAAVIAASAIRRALRTCSIQVGHPAPITTHVQINGEWLNVHIHKLMETGTAARNGYLWTEATSQAYGEGSS